MAREKCGLLAVPRTVPVQPMRNPTLACLSTRRMASRIGISRMQLWRTLHEEVLYPYHDQMVQHLEPADHAQLMDLCHWMTAHPELLSVTLFTDEGVFYPGRYK